MQDRKTALKIRMTEFLQTRLRNTAPRMSVINAVGILIAIVLSILCMSIMGRITGAFGTARETNNSYEECERSVERLQEASDYLTTKVRLFASTAERTHMDDYLEELVERDQRGKAVQALRSQASSDTAISALERAQRYSNDLVDTELYAMRLVADANGITDLPDLIQAVHLNAEDSELPKDEKMIRAYDMVYGEDYLKQKLRINNSVYNCTGQLMAELHQKTEESDAAIAALMGGLRMAVIALLLVVVFIIISTLYLVLWPMSLHVKHIREDIPLIPSGSAELRYLTDAYNEMYEEKHQRTLSLQQEAETDGLTGLLNRSAFESLIGSGMHNIALVLVDVDYFKSFNDNYGHDMGDAILIEVAATLVDAFRASDYVCRIGGDEFAVIMTAADRSMYDAVAKKLKKVADFLRDTSNGLPSVTISVGVAFYEDVPEGGDLFKTADQALYVTKRNGRNGYTFACDTH